MHRAHDEQNWQHICLANYSNAFAIFIGCIVAQILFLPSESQALTFLCLLEGDGAYRAGEKRRRENTSLNGYSGLPVRAAVVWDVWAAADVCVWERVCEYLAGDVLILMEELGVSGPACDCVSMSKVLWWDEEVGTSWAMELYKSDSLKSWLWW